MMAVALFGLLSSTPWAAGPEHEKEAPIYLTSLDFDECEPVVLRSKIMEVHPQKGMMIVAEREIRAMDVMMGGRVLRTAYLTIEGKPKLPTAFRPGQYVLVKGFQHPEGYIAASMVQQIEKPVEKKMKYKPVEMNKQSSQRRSAVRSVQ